MDLKEFIKSKESHKRTLGKRLLEGARLDELAKEYPELVFGYQRLESDIKCLRRAQRTNKPLCESMIPNTWSIDLPILTGKRRHYWIWSKKGDYGKTTFWENLSKEFKTT